MVYLLHKHRLLHVIIFGWACPSYSRFARSLVRRHGSVTSGFLLLNYPSISSADLAAGIDSPAEGSIDPGPAREHQARFGTCVIPAICYSQASITSIFCYPFSMVLVWQMEGILGVKIRFRWTINLVVFTSLLAGLSLVLLCPALSYVIFAAKSGRCRPTEARHPPAPDLRGARVRCQPTERWWAQLISLWFQADSTAAVRRMLRCEFGQDLPRWSPPQPQRSPCRRSTPPRRPKPPA